MIYLKPYRVFESIQDGVTPEQRELLDTYCKPYRNRYDGTEIDPMKLWWVDKNGLVNVEGDFTVNPTNHKYKGWTGGLLGIKFGNVKGNFGIDGVGLEDASDLPRAIGGHLNADDNKFRTLEGIGMVKMSISMGSNLLVSLEGMTEDLFTPNAKFRHLSGNPIKGAILMDDLEQVLAGYQTWTGIYLDMVEGEYQIKDVDETITWILENKLGPEILEDEIKKDPAKMAVKLGKLPSKYKKIIGERIDKIGDLPPEFRGDIDLISDLSDVGL